MKSTVSYVSVKLAPVAIFRKLDLDYLSAVRCQTCTISLVQNPVERIMLILNLAFQENRIACQRRWSFLRRLHWIPTALVKILLTDTVRRLDQKQHNLNLFLAATIEEMNEIWTVLFASDQEF